jgi:hypothetical protein
MCLYFSTSCDKDDPVKREPVIIHGKLPSKSALKRVNPESAENLSLEEATRVLLFSKDYLGNSYTLAWD